MHCYPMHFIFLIAMISLNIHRCAIDRIPIKLTLDENIRFDWIWFQVAEPSPCG